MSLSSQNAGDKASIRQANKLVLSLDSGSKLTHADGAWLKCDLTGCSTQEVAPEAEFRLVQGEGWRVAYEASPNSTDSFAASVGGEGWSLAMNAREYHDFCQLLRAVRASILRLDPADVQEPLQIQARGSHIWLEATVPAAGLLPDLCAALNGSLDGSDQAAGFDLRFGLISAQSGAVGGRAAAQVAHWPAPVVADALQSAGELFGVPHGGQSDEQDEARRVAAGVFVASLESTSDTESLVSLEEQLHHMRQELAAARAQVRASEARVRQTLDRMAELESLVQTTRVVDPLPRESSSSQGDAAEGSAPSASTGRAEGSLAVVEKAEAILAAEPAELQSAAETAASQGRVAKGKRKGKAPRRTKLDTSGPLPKYAETLKNFWFPVAFSKDVDASTLIPFDCFEEPWVVFRGPDGKPGCIRDECAHRACPLSIGTVVDGHAVCPYHGWEFNPSGKCTKMPSTRLTDVRVRALPCVEHEGMIWVWPGSATPTETLPSTMPPPSYTVHAEIVIELPVEHGLLVENLLDLAHAPFTHTTTFAKGWSVPSLVRFKSAAAQALQGHWDPYPIAMEFRPPCMVVSTIGLVKPGQLEGQASAQECTQHLFQLHACLPSSRGKTRLLYRMGLDFAQWVKFVPFIDRLWKSLANQVLDEDLRLVVGQQDRMRRVTVASPQTSAARRRPSLALTPSDFSLAFVASSFASRDSSLTALVSLRARLVRGLFRMIHAVSRFFPSHFLLPSTVASSRTVASLAHASPFAHASRVPPFCLFPFRIFPSRRPQRRKLVERLGPVWSDVELRAFYRLLRAEGKNWRKVVAELPGRTEEMAEALFNMNRVSPTPPAARPHVHRVR
ncbi:unnamed protein product [Closterium sp. Yama58-4]|nr:unnamed protein product [Closterium sp. Yama58-4]